MGFVRDVGKKIDDEIFQPIVDLSDDIDGTSGKEAAKDAAKAQVKATEEAQGEIRQMYDLSRQDLAPSRALGNNALFALAGSQGVAPSLRQLGVSMGLDENQLSQLMSMSGGGYQSPRTSAPTPIAGQEVSVNRSAAPSGSYDPLVEEAYGLYTSGQKYTSPADLVQQDPGYQFRLDQGTKALERSAAASGGLFSGKTGKALTEYSQGVASQEYGNAYNRLAALAGIGTSATSQQVNANQNQGAQLSDLTTQAGNARASGYVGAANAGAQGTQNLMQLGTMFAMASDRRVKEDITEVGKTAGGFPVYTYRYIGQPTVHMGVMAQDIENEIPGAVIEIDGIKHVDYSKVH